MQVVSQADTADVVAAEAAQLLITAQLTAAAAAAELAHAACAVMPPVDHMAKAVVSADMVELVTVQAAAQDKVDQAAVVVTQVSHIQTHMAEAMHAVAGSAAAAAVAVPVLAAAGEDLELLELFGAAIELGLAQIHTIYNIV